MKENTTMRIEERIPLPIYSRGIEDNDLPADYGNENNCFGRRLTLSEKVDLKKKYTKTDMWIMFLVGFCSVFVIGGLIVAIRYF